MSRMLVSFLATLILLACGLSFYPMEKDKQLERLEQRQRMDLPPAPQESRFALAQPASEAPR